MQTLKTGKLPLLLLTTAVLLQGCHALPQQTSPEPVTVVQKTLPLPALTQPLPPKGQTYSLRVQRLLQSWQNGVTDTLKTSE